MALITCRDVSLSYESNVVLSDLTFEIEQGDYLCIVGENGSGKSTLVKALLSLKNVRSGEIVFGDGLCRREIGYLPQQSAAQRDFPASVWEVVISGCLAQRGFKPFYGKDERRRAEENLEKFGIADLRDRSYRELSGGQQQRVLLARALSATRKLILLDEPVTGLDPIASQELYSLTKQLCEEGITIVMVSHDIPSAVKYATKILHLHNKPLFFGRTEDYIKSGVGLRFLGGNADA